MAGQLGRAVMRQGTNQFTRIGKAIADAIREKERQKILSEFQGDFKNTYKDVTGLSNTFDDTAKSLGLKQNKDYVPETISSPYPIIDKNERERIANQKKQDFLAKWALNDKLDKGQITNADALLGGLVQNIQNQKADVNYEGLISELDQSITAKTPMDQYKQATQKVGDLLSGLSNAGATEKQINNAKMLMDEWLKGFDKESSMKPTQQKYGVNKVLTFVDDKGFKHTVWRDNNGARHEEVSTVRVRDNNNNRNGNKNNKPPFYKNSKTPEYLAAAQANFEYIKKRIDELNDDEQKKAQKIADLNQQLNTVVRAEGLKKITDDVKKTIGSRSMTLSEILDTYDEYLKSNGKKPLNQYQKDVINTYFNITNSDTYKELTK